MKDTIGYSYFAIKTENEKLDVDEFEKYLSIKPTNFQKMMERRKSPVCTIWEYSTERLKNPYFFEEIEKLISKLNEHKLEFIKLKNDYSEIEFVLEVVIHLGDETPGLHFSKKALEFVTEIGGVIDCDIYNSK
jgi:hypothetical protein